MSSIPVASITYTDPNCFNKFIDAAIQFDQEVLAIEREMYLNNYNNIPHFFVRCALLL